MPDTLARGQSETGRGTTFPRPELGMGCAPNLASVSLWGAIRPAVFIEPLIVSGYSEYPPVVNLVRLWDDQGGWRISDLNATSLRITLTHTVTRTVEPSAESSLEDLARWTDLSNDAIAYLVGASRRSIYNWRNGSTIPKKTAPRILEARRAVEPLAAFWPALVVGRWLMQGEPSPGDLAHQERWPELQAAIQEELAPIAAEPLIPGVGEVSESESLEFARETRQAILERFSSRSVLAPRRSTWAPREETGLGEYETDDD